MQGKVIKKVGRCPRCGGTGRARQFNKEQKYNEKTRTRAAVLYESGVSLRVIAKRLGIKHPQTVKNIISYK